MAQGFSVDSATEFIATAFEPITHWRTDREIIDFVATLGWNLPGVPDRFHDTRASAQALVDAVGELELARFDGDDIGPKLLAIVAALGVTLGNIHDLADSIIEGQDGIPTGYRAASGIANLVPDQNTGPFNELEKRLLDVLVVDAVSNLSQPLRALLLAIGVVQEDEEAPNGTFQPAFLHKQINLERLRLLVSDPSALLEEVYGWGTPDIDEVRLFNVIREIGYGFLAGGTVRTPSQAFIDAVLPGAPTQEISDMMEVPLHVVSYPPLAIALLPAPKANPDEKQGLALRISGSSDATITIPAGPVTVSLGTDLALDAGVGILLKPDDTPAFFSNVDISGQPASAGNVSLDVRSVDVEHAYVLADFGGGSTLSVKSFFGRLALAIADSDFGVEAGVTGGELKVSLASADGFLKEVVPSDGFKVEFDLTIGWFRQRGLAITGSAGFETVLTLNKTFGPVFLRAIRLALRAGAEGLRLQAGLGVAIKLGPITAVVEDIGVESLLEFKSGNLGPLDLSADFLFPTGIGIAIDSAAVKGGGFLRIDRDAGRYAGVLELQVFKVAIKAFGVLDTKFPDGSDGYSFVIVIMAEFTPIQLGFGFTLLGVGGLLGVNRTVNADALGDAVRTGSLEHLLFPHDVIKNAPAIIHDLGTIFPPSRGHFIFGPMAKLGWGTPTIISADLGIVIEFPGPRIALLGLVHMLLPDPKTPVVAFNMAIAGLLDFPAKKISVDASLFDSIISGYPVSGDMAYRQEYGEKSNFLLSIGGFNTGFTPPAPFPTLRRVSVDIGVSGNPSLTCNGYFALTPNSAQIGSSMELYASGYGITVNGWIGFDAMFEFSPFSFTGTISAGIRASFHGAGFGITLNAKLTGPNPWHLTGRVCVSVLWWDACLPIDHTFGNDQQVALPEIDPWLGDAAVPVRGLKDAIADAGNWAGSGLVSDLNVVTLAEASTAVRTPIDPLGAATLRQKVVPFNRKLEKFGEYRPKNRERFSLGRNLGEVKVNGAVVTNEVSVVDDDFVPGHFMELTNEEKLSLPSYEKMNAGIAIAPNRTLLGSAQSSKVEFVTKFIDDERVVHDDVTRPITQEELDGHLERSPAAQGGVRRTGAERFMLKNRPRKIQLDPPAFVVADACTLVQNMVITGTETSQTLALLALRDHVRQNPQDRERFAVIPTTVVRAA